MLHEHFIYFLGLPAGDQIAYSELSTGITPSLAEVSNRKLIQIKFTVDLNRSNFATAQNYSTGINTDHGLLILRIETILFCSMEAKNLIFLHEVIDEIFRQGVFGVIFR